MIGVVSLSMAVGGLHYVSVIDALRTAAYTGIAHRNER